MSHLTIKQRAEIASRYEVYKSVILVQRWFRQTYDIHQTLSANTIKNCHAKLMNTGAVLDAPRAGRQSTSCSGRNIAKVRRIFDADPQKSVRKASLESGLSTYTIHKVCLLWQGVDLKFNK